MNQQAGQQIQGGIEADYRPVEPLADWLETPPEGASSEEARAILAAMGDPQTFRNAPVLPVGAALARHRGVSDPAALIDVLTGHRDAQTASLVPEAPAAEPGDDSPGPLPAAVEEETDANLPDVDGSGSVLADLNDRVGRDHDAPDDDAFFPSDEVSSARKEEEASPPDAMSEPGWSDEAFLSEGESVMDDPFAMFDGQPDPRGESSSGAQAAGRTGNDGADVDASEEGGHSSPIETLERSGFDDGDPDDGPSGGDPFAEIDDLRETQYRDPFDEEEEAAGSSGMPEDPPPAPPRQVKGASALSEEYLSPEEFVEVLDAGEGDEEDDGIAGMDEMLGEMEDELSSSILSDVEAHGRRESVDPAAGSRDPDAEPVSGPEDDPAPLEDAEGKDAGEPQAEQRPSRKRKLVLLAASVAIAGAGFAGYGWWKIRTDPAFMMDVADGIGSILPGGSTSPGPDVPSAGLPAVALPPIPAEITDLAGDGIPPAVPAGEIAADDPEPGPDGNIGNQVVSAIDDNAGDPLTDVEISGDLARLNAEIEAIEGEQGSPDVEGEIGEVSPESTGERLDAIGGEIAEISGRLSSLEERFDQNLAALSADVEMRMNRIAQTAAAFSSVLTTMASLETRVESLEARGRNAETELAEIGSIRADIRNLGDRLGEISSDLWLIARFGAGLAGQGSSASMPPLGTGSAENVPLPASRPRSPVNDAMGRSAAHFVADPGLRAGKYKAGDFVDGYGKVLAIRKADGGEYLVTENGTLFASGR